MNKMAIFAEGRTEVEFNSKLIQEIASTKAISIESRKIRGGSKVPRRVETINVVHADGKGDLTTHFFLLVDCGNEDLPKARIRQEYPNLVASGYTEILCHRDVAPNVTYADLPKLEIGLRLYVPTVPIKVKFILSVMEVEAWFLADHGHFMAIDPSLSLSTVSSIMGFDPSTFDIRQRPSPAKDLATCYAAAGKVYDKVTSQTTIDAIDYVNVYVEVAPKFPHLEVLRDTIEAFLST